MTDEKDKQSTSASSFFGIREMIAYITAGTTTAITSWFAVGRRMGSNFEELSKQAGSEANIIHNRMLQEASAMPDLSLVKDPPRVLNRVESTNLR